MIVARTLQELHRARQDLLTPTESLALVPTMGALHEGHIALIRAALAQAHKVAASIFVNPTQFNENDDLSRYPRDGDADLALLDEAGCALVWYPMAEIMYPPGSETSIDVGAPARLWEGAARPGHFRGVATVVTKLFNQLRPDCAYFGEKDWQQLQVIRALVGSLFLPVTIHPVATLREADGLAMSSRNRFLSPPERVRAGSLFRCLVRAEAAIADGDPVSVVLATAREDLQLRGMEVDYLALVAGPALLPLQQLGSGEQLQDIRLIAAARLGDVRLLDNVAVRLPVA